LRMTLHLSKLTLATALLATTAIAGTIASTAATAVDVSFWTHDTPEAHAEARLENVVVTSYGIVRLARALEPVAIDLGHAGGVYATTPLSDGGIAVGTGPEG